MIMGQENLKELLKKQASKMGVTLFGVASPNTWDDEPGFHPKDVFPGTKSVIIIGSRYIYGSISSLSFRSRLVGLASGPGRANALAFNLSRWLQTKGYYALPTPEEIAVEMEQMQYDPSYKTLYRPQFDNRKAAVAAGLGHIGKNGMVVTPTVGPRVAWCAILTDAILEPDPPFTQDLCGDCSLCVDECPEVLTTGWTYESCWRATQIKGLPSSVQFKQRCLKPCMTACPLGTHSVKT
jgi:epoxyqueuosine reductase QueG